MWQTRETHDSWNRQEALRSGVRINKPKWQQEFQEPRPSGEKVHKVIIYVLLFFFSYASLLLYWSSHHSFLSFSHLSIFITITQTNIVTFLKFTTVTSTSNYGEMLRPIHSHLSEVALQLHQHRMAEAKLIVMRHHFLVFFKVTPSETG